MTDPAASLCDPLTGLCTPATLVPAAVPTDYRDDAELIYVGDPLCSWCWGISPALHQLERAARDAGIPYRIVVGGLRPDDGQAWTAEFRAFLRHHWEAVHAGSGQPFGYALFDRAAFSYNTEPPCRAVAAARSLRPEVASRFFELVQHRFYVVNEDPGEVEFYRPICVAVGLDFAAFVAAFHDPLTHAATQADFQRSRGWGVTGFPTVIFRREQQLYAIARGFTTYDRMWAAVTELLSTPQ